MHELTSEQYLVKLFFGISLISCCLMDQDFKCQHICPFASTQQRAIFSIQLNPAILINYAHAVGVH